VTLQTQRVVEKQSVATDALIQPQVMSPEDKRSTAAHPSGADAARPHRFGTAAGPDIGCHTISYHHLPAFCFVRSTGERKAIHHR